MHFRNRNPHRFPNAPANDLDCSITPISVLKEDPQSHLLLSSTDFFFPLIDDPYLQGIIACANVFSDLYALGVTEIDNVLMILGISDAIESLSHRETVLKLLMKGFSEGARIAGASISGGQTVINASPIIGGVASTVIERHEMVQNDCIKVGDFLVLTKPLGTDTAVRLYHQTAHSLGMPEDETFSTKESYALAVRSMAHFNKIAGGLLRQHNSTGATDVTGYGLIGHAENLASVQRSPVAFRFFVLPCIHNTVYLHTKEARSLNAKLVSGRAVETSGGLLAGFRTLEAADAYLADVRRIGGTEGWVVGRGVQKRDELAFLQSLRDDRSLVYERHSPEAIHTIPVEKKDDVIHVLELRESDVFLPVVPPISNPCQYDQKELAKRLS